MNKEKGMPAQVIYQQYPETDDEIDISELFNKILLRQKFILALVFIATTVTAGLLSLQWLVNPPEQRYALILQFNFPQSEKGLYPSGQPFSYNDIVSAKVLEEVYKRNNLASHNINFEKFIGAVTVSPFSENELFIKEKYQGLLANKKLSRPEIESLESTFLNELKTSQSRFVMLSFLESDLKGLDNVLIQKILNDIPRVWSQMSIEELGVLDLKIVGANFYQPDLIERFEYLQTLEYLKDSSKYLGQALDTLVEDEIGGFVRSTTADQSAVDLQIQLKNLIAFEIEPLFSTITNLGITKDSSKALIYMQNTIQNLADKKDVLKNKANNIESIITQYAESNSIKNISQQEGAAGGFAQYDSSFLDKFTSLIEEKNDKAYKQNLLNQRLEVLQEMEEVDGQIIKFQRAEKTLLGNLSSVSDDTQLDVVKDIGYARTNFEKLVEGYKELLAVRNQQVLGNTANLYEITSNELVVNSGLTGRLKKIILYSVLVGVIALMMAVVIALFRPAPVNRQVDKAGNG